MSTAAERAAHLELVGRLKSAYPEMPDAPPPDLLDHERFLAYMKTVHDVGGEPDAPMKYENKTSTSGARSTRASPTTGGGCGPSRGCWWRNTTSASVS
jgi:hypothetical protein